jgi:hypothetical protein
MATQMSRIIPVFRIFDVAKAREFYLEFLGFAVVFEHRSSRVCRFTCAWRSARSCWT